MFDLCDLVGENALRPQCFCLERRATALAGLWPFGTSWSGKKSGVEWSGVSGMRIWVVFANSVFLCYLWFSRCKERVKCVSNFVSRYGNLGCVCL